MKEQFLGFCPDKVNEILSFLSSAIPSADIDSDNIAVFPGFVDVHVHLREPGFLYKETIKSGTLAAAHGGYTTVFSMPNLNPVPDSAENLKVQLEVIQKDAVIRVLPYGAITVGQKGAVLSDLAGMAEKVCAFSDDGKGVQNPEMMRAAMKQAKSLGKVICAHCEDEALLCGGCIHDGVFARENGFTGISSESEWRQVERDIELVRETGASYHVCHVSAKESVELIRRAKKEGLDITCETGPHYLTMDENDLRDEGRFKMNPPLRSKEDRIALIEGIKDGTIDMIATDHAPHSAEEKSKGLRGSLMGIVGIETAFPILYTNLVMKGIITLEKLIDLLSIAPRRRFGIEQKLDFSVWSLKESYKINPADFLSMGRATPFEGWEVFGKCLLTVCNGQIVWNTLKTEEQ